MLMKLSAFLQRETPQELFSGHYFFTLPLQFQNSDYTGAARNCDLIFN